ncbi:hypothetical protein BKA59DRAFT_397858, partial [Fusarium tricinctum]
SRDCPNNPLDARAWTLQEQYLSRRQLRFPENRILWECHKMVIGKSKRDASGITKRIIPPSLNLPGRAAWVWNAWYSLVSQYSRRVLSAKADRYPTLSGLAVIIAKDLSSQYCAGM